MQLIKSWQDSLQLLKPRNIVHIFKDTVALMGTVLWTLTAWWYLAPLFFTVGLSLYFGMQSWFFYSGMPYKLFGILTGFFYLLEAHETEQEKDFKYFFYRICTIIYTLWPFILLFALISWMFSDRSMSYDRSIDYYVISYIIFALSVFIYVSILYMFDSSYAFFTLIRNVFLLFWYNLPAWVIFLFSAWLMVKVIIFFIGSYAIFRTVHTDYYEMTIIILSYTFELFLELVITCLTVNLYKRLKNTI